MKIAIGSDHGGFPLKEVLVDYLKGKNHEVIDVGTNSTTSVDYPDFAGKVGNSVQTGEADLGIMIDGAGIGSAMALNKMNGILAAVCNEIYVTRNSKAHNNANVMTMGSMVVGPGLAKELVDIFINTKFEGDRHERRVSKIHALASSNSSITYDVIKKLITEIVRKLYSNNLFSQSSETKVNETIDKKLITEDDIKKVQKISDSLHVKRGTIITALAKDYARDNRIKIIFED